MGQILYIYLLSLVLSTTPSFKQGVEPIKLFHYYPEKSSDNKDLVSWITTGIQLLGLLAIWYTTRIQLKATEENLLKSASRERTKEILADLSALVQLIYTNRDNTNFTYNIQKKKLGNDEHHAIETKLLLQLNRAVEQEKKVIESITQYKNEENTDLETWKNTIVDSFNTIKI